MKILFVAGDPSGDLLASKLAVSLQRHNSSIHIASVGGENLEKVSDRFIINIVRQHALGFAISFKTIWSFRNILNNVISPFLINNRPDAVILVDFYGFNSRVAKLAKAAGIKVFYYVSPQFWASRPGRAEHLRPYVDLFLCLFPFELEFFQRRQMAARFVGHPIIDELPQHPNNVHVLPRVESLVGLLPGSRPEEIRRHLPIMVEVCRQVAEQYPGTRFVLFTVAHVHRDYYLDFIDQNKTRSFFIEMIRDEHYAWRSQLDVALSASGMETLENALLGIPMVVMYKTNWITYLVARSLIQIPFLAMPNLLAKCCVVPEFIQHKAKAKDMVIPVLNWLGDPKSRMELRQKLLALRSQFGDPGASDRAASQIIERISK